MQSWIFVVLLTGGVADAQAPPPSFITTPVPRSGAASPKVMFIKPGSEITPAVGEQQFEQRTHWVQASENAKDFLGKNGLVADSRTIASFKILNPQIGPDGVIPAGSRVSLFAPKPAVNANLNVVGAKASINMAEVARYSVSNEVARAQQVKLQTLQLPATAYVRASDIAAHRALVSDIDSAAVLVAQRADRMSARDLALSKYYLASASQAAANTHAFAVFKPLSDGNITYLQSAVAPVQSMRVMMSSGGAPFKYRWVQVSVTSRPGALKAPPLRVYVLPGGMIENPGKYDEELLMKLLAELTFERLTSPARSTVPYGDIRVWVGQDGQYEAMARLVREKKAFGFTPVRGTTVDDQELLLTFTAPDDVVKP